MAQTQALVRAKTLLTLDGIRPGAICRPSDGPCCVRLSAGAQTRPDKRAKKAGRTCTPTTGEKSKEKLVKALAEQEREIGADNTLFRPTADDGFLPTPAHGRKALRCSTHPRFSSVLAV